MDLTGYVTVEEAHEITGYTLGHLWRLARAGEAGAVKVARSYLFNLAELLRHKETAKPGPAPGTPSPRTKKREYPLLE